VAAYSRSATKTDVARRADIAAAAADALERFGRIDFVVNTAGVLPISNLVDTTEETIWSATEVNYIAPILIAQEFHPHLKATQGSMLLFTSSSYTRGRKGYSLYSSAKAGTVNLTQALADEWAEDGVRINVVNPERTGTPMRTKAFGEEPADSLLQSEAVARASLDTLIGTGTGHVVDLRRLDPIAAALASGLE
jgi:2-C-methyl-D-erythritol 4-phosphate cytidylyltransferase